jgi:hypothetical protein
MAVAEGALLIVASQEYVEAPDRKGEVSPGVVRGFAAEGWALTGARAAQLVVEFADGRGQAAGGADLPQIEGLPMVARLPAVATARIPIQTAEFRRGTEVCSVELAELAEPLAQAWAAQVAPPETLTRLKAGQAGRADDKGMIVRGARTLVRVSLSQEGPGSNAARAAAAGLLSGLASAAAV